MSDFDFVYTEVMEFDDSLDRMDSKSKYEKISRIFKRTPDRSQAFILGAKHILHFAKTFKNLTIEDFRGMIRLSRAQYKSIYCKSEEDKKFLLLLYLELLKESRRMTKHDFFISIWKAKELNDYAPYFVYFGRIFSEECNYESLRILVEYAKSGLGGKFSGVKELLDFEKLVLSHLQFVPRKSIPPTENIVFMFKEYEGMSYNEVFSSKCKVIDVPPNEDVMNSTCEKIEHHVNETTTPVNDVSCMESNDKENTTVDVDESIVSCSVNTTLKPLSPTKEGESRRFGDASNLEAISFCTNISNKLASAFSETLPPQDFSVNNGTILDETIPPPNFVTPARVSLKRDRSGLVSMEEKMVQEKEFSVFEDDNMTRTQVYVDQTGDIDNSILDEDLIRSPLRKKKVGCLGNQIAPSRNISTVVEEDDVVMEDIAAEPVKEVVSKKEATPLLVSKDLTTSFNSSRITDNSKVSVCSANTMGNRSSNGSVHSFEFKGSFEIPTKADEDITTPLPQKNAPRQSLMTASTPCKGSQPMQMDECSFYCDLSEIKGDDDDDEELISKPLEDGSKCSLLEDKDVTIQASFQRSETHFLNSSESNDTLKVKNAKSGEILFDFSDSHVSDDHGSVDLFNAIGSQDETVLKIASKSSSGVSGNFSQRGGFSLLSRSLERTVIDNGQNLDDTVQAVTNDMEVGDLEVNKEKPDINMEVEVNNVDMSVKESEEGRTLHVSSLDAKTGSYCPDKSCSEATSELQLCEKRDIGSEQQSIPEVEATYNASNNEENVVDQISRTLDKDDKCTPLKEKNTIIQNLSQKSEIHLLSPQQTADSVDLPKENTVQFRFDSSVSHVNESSSTYDLFQAIGSQDKTASNVIDKDVTVGNDNSSVKCGDFLGYSSLNKTAINNKLEMEENAPAVNDKMSIVNLETSEEAHISKDIAMEDVNLPPRKFEDDCTPEHSRLDNVVDYTELGVNAIKLIDEVETCKDKDFSSEQQITLETKPLFNISVDKKHGEESFSKHIEKEEENLPMDEDFSSVNVSSRSEVNLLSSPKCDKTMESAEAVIVNSSFNLSHSNTSRGCDKVDKLPVNETQDKTALEISVEVQNKTALEIPGEDMIRNDGLFSQRDECIFNSSCLTSNNETVDSNIKAVDSEMTEEIHKNSEYIAMEDTNVSDEKSEKGCTSEEVFESAATVDSSKLDESASKPTNEMEICKENIDREQQEIQEIESRSNVSDNKGHNENLFGESSSLPADEDVTRGSLSDRSGTCSSPSRKSGNGIEATGLSTPSITFNSSISHPSKNCGNVDLLQADGYQSNSFTKVVDEDIPRNNSVSSQIIETTLNPNECSEKGLNMTSQAVDDSMEVCDSETIKEDPQFGMDIDMEDVKSSAKNLEEGCTLDNSKLHTTISSPELCGKVNESTDEIFTPKKDIICEQQEVLNVKPIFDVSNGCEDIFSNDLKEDEEKSLIVCKDTTIQVLSQRSETHLLCSPHSGVTLESSASSTVDIIFDSSISHVNRSYNNVNFSQINKSQIQSSVKVVGENTDTNNELSPQINKNVLNSSCLNISEKDNELELNNDFKTNKEESQPDMDIDIKDANVSSKKLEGECNSEILSVQENYTSLFENINKSIDDVEMNNKEEDIFGKQQDTSNVQSIFDISNDKEHDGSLVSMTLENVNEVSPQINKSGFNSSSLNISEKVNEIELNKTDPVVRSCSEDNGLKTNEEESQTNMDIDMEDANVSSKKLEGECNSGILNAEGNSSKLFGNINKSMDDVEINNKEVDVCVNQQNTSNFQSTFDISNDKEHGENLTSMELGNINEVSYKINKSGFNSSSLNISEKDNELELSKTVPVVEVCIVDNDLKVNEEESQTNMDIDMEDTNVSNKKLEGECNSGILNAEGNSTKLFENIAESMDDKEDNCDKQQDILNVQSTFDISNDKEHSGNPSSMTLGNINSNELTPQVNRNVSNSSCLNISQKDNEPELDNTVPIVEDCIKDGDLKINKEESQLNMDINMEDANVSSKILEGECNSTVLNTEENPTKLFENITQSIDEVEKDKEENMYRKQQDTSNIQSIFDISNDKENSGNLTSKTLGNESECLLLGDETSTLKYLSSKYGIHSISSSKSESILESPKSKIINSLFNSSDSHPNGNLTNVNLLQVEGIQDQTTMECFSSNTSSCSEIFSQRSGNVLDSSCDKGLFSNKAVLTVSQLKINKEESFTNKGIHVGDLNVSTKKIEEECSLNNSKLDYTTTSLKLSGNISKSTNEMDICKEIGIGVEQQKSLSIESTFNISRNKTLDGSITLNPHGNDENNSSFVDENSTLKYLTDKYKINLLSSPKSDGVLESPK